VRHWRLSFLQQWLSRAGLPDLGHIASFLWRCRAEYAAADVVHLHNLHGDYLSLLALPLWGRDKPLVWTLHDAWPLTGNCAYPRDCPRWRAGCGRCPNRFSRSSSGSSTRVAAARTGRGDGVSRRRW